MKSLVSHEGLHCANCATPLAGEFCHECGQSMHSVLKPMHHMAEETVETLLHIDGRIVHTLPALFFKPGFLSLEYFSGRRVRYIAPFRLMFVLCLLAFFVLHHVTSESVVQRMEQHQRSVLLDDGNAFAQADGAAEVHELFERKANELDAVQTFGSDATADKVASARQKLFDAANQRLAQLHASPLPAADASRRTTALPTALAPRKAVEPVRIGWLPDFANQRLTAIAQHFDDNWQAYKHGDPATSEAAKQRMLGGVFAKLPGAMLVLVPLFALLLKLSYVFKRRLYMEHVIVVLHSQAFLFLWLLLLTLLSMFAHWLKPHAAWATLPMNLLEQVLVWWAPLYLLLTQKRIYRQGWPMTALKFWCIGWCYFWLLLLVLLIAVVLGLAH